MTFSRCTLALLLALPATGCTTSTPSDPDAGTDAGGLTVDEYCPTQAEVYCSGWESCCGLSSSYDECVAWMLDECEAGEISSVRAGHSHLDGEVAERCLDAYARSFDDCMRDDDLESACRYRWYGDAAAGEPCRDVWHCQRGLGCVLEGTSGTCIELPASEESCEETGVCEPGSYCSYEDWTCHDDPGLDEPCEREGICAAGRCTDGTCQAEPWCD